MIFQSTLPREERRLCVQRKDYDTDFNPRSHERSDASDVGDASTTLFQSTLPREERHVTAAEKRAVFDISIHAPTRGATNSKDSDIHWICISIHAPTRGATGSPDRNQQVNAISIHAPTRGATAILHKKFVYFYTIPTINI